MSHLHKLILVIGFFGLVSNCDTKKEYTNDITANMLCYTLAACNKSNPSKVGMIGDSWTDLLLGFPAVDALRVQLEKNHGYQITGATLGGQTLNAALNLGLHFQVIDQAGADIHSIILSLGGNDIQARLSEYSSNPDSVQAERLSTIKSQLRTMIQSGNAYKISKYGGQPIRWIIHGYDYSNPFKTPVILNSDEGCKSAFASAGIVLTDSEVPVFSAKQLDGFNEMLRSFTKEEPYFYYVDLRKTLGGPNISNPDLMLDCIHPNSLGFSLLAGKLAPLIAPITKEGN
ncbi:SGNH/GDSL hydrolase family protein [Leptospira ilyithenensis]|uniref:SGNH/GDSL hydrolase family protein n=1 Tax=Leptospira ilyithenensis TaxID=2484901 RepID=A0A4R9LRD9_9LEPT|nr:SGNH/GDSL hydrolase family protein [Leptospira ilyithenensis]TGN10942.1 SGNH/GDSL hydrolase family protein [Leptospira ilyithenensis]